QQLVARGAAYARRAPAQKILREEHAGDGGARRPRFSRVYAASARAYGTGARLSQDCLRTAARRVYDRYAQLPWAERREPEVHLWARRVFPGADAGGLGEARPQSTARAREGDRRRYADWALRCL